MTTATQTPKKRWQFPTAYTVLFVVLILAAALTYILPSGKYAKLSYSSDDKAFVITAPKGETKTMPGTQETLEQLGVKIDLEQFTNESIYKPIAIPNTYEALPANPTTFYDFVSSPIKGFYETKDIALFVLILGGIIGVLNTSGAINAGFAALSRKTQGNEFVLIILVTCLIAAGGTTYGMAEETIALYPIIIPIFLVAGYDALVGIAAIYLGSCIGTTFSTINVFAVGIASSAAGTTPAEGMGFRLAGLIIGTLIVLAYLLRYASKVKRDPSRSLVYDQREEVHAALMKNRDDSVPEFTASRAISLLIFMATFGVMMWGIIFAGWWFEEMTALFLISGFLIILVTIFFSDLSEKETVNSFITGAADLIGVALILGLARAVNFLLDEGLVSDTILFNATQLVDGMNPILFIVVMMFIFVILGFFIPSSSGLAVLSMPIMAPLADTVGLPRDTIVSAYQYGQGIIAAITPTGLILVALSMSHITYDKWLKFVMPLVGIITALALAILVAQVAMI